MVDVQICAENLHRGVKMALDTGEAKTVEEGYAIFARYRVGVVVGGDVATSPSHQAALLTIVNTGHRALLGGVEVAGVPPDAPLLVGAQTGFLGDALRALGARLVDRIGASTPVLALGAGEMAGYDHLSARVTFGGWSGGVTPLSDARLREGAQDILAAVWAAAVGVSEVFQSLRGNVMGLRRAVGINLWKPAQEDWRVSQGPERVVAPSRLWIVGLGHLGQAYLWTLGLLPYLDAGEVEITLQDFDVLAESNLSTSVLTDASGVGRHKTRAMSAWCEGRGFRTRLVERRFVGDVRLQPDDPRVLLFGVDNAEARAALEEPGFDLVVEAGLGGGPQDYLAIRVQTFPASVTARSKWGGVVDEESATANDKPAYANLAARGFNECGLVEMASRTVGAPFVGVAAAVLVITEVLRRLNGGSSVEVIDLTLRDPSLRSVVADRQQRRRFNPGFATLNV